MDFILFFSTHLKHFDTLFYSSEEHFISDNLDKVSKYFKIVKGPPIQSLLQIISPCRLYYFVLKAFKASLYS